jgi:hypothetical protein
MSIFGQGATFTKGLWDHCCILIFRTPRPLLLLAVFLFFALQKNTKGRKMKKLLFGLLGILFLGTSWSATLPAGYKELEYIESTGTQWIDTGIIRGRFVHDIVFTERTQNNLMGGSTGGGLYWGQTRSHISSNDGYELGPNHIDVDTSVRRIIEYSNISSHAKLTTGNTTITYSISTPSNTYTIFKIHNSEQYYTKTKLYGLKVYTTDDNTSLVRNFVPAKNSSGVVGMYDLADPNPATAFHTNAGAGTFTAGPEI